MEAISSTVGPQTTAAGVAKFRIASTVASPNTFLKNSIIFKYDERAVADD